VAVDLGAQHHITLEDLIEKIVHALDHSEPFGLTRWADSSNTAMKFWNADIKDPGPEGPIVFQYRGARLTYAYYPEYAPVFLHGAQTCDVLGTFVDDIWAKQIMDTLPLDLTGKPLVMAWCNKFLHARREYVEQVFERPWRTALVGNRMPEFQGWLAEHFPKLEIVQVGIAKDWPDVAQAIEEFEVTRPELVLASAGWFTSCFIGAARDLGAVAISCGHLPDWWMMDPIHAAPNTEFPRGIEGAMQHYAAHYPEKLELMLPVRDIILEAK